MPDSPNLPVPLRSRPIAMLDQLAAIPEEEVWLAKQKSARTRRAYRLDVRHFMRAFDITTTDILPGRSSRRYRLGAHAAGAGMRCGVDGTPAAGGAVEPVQASGEARGGEPQSGRRRGAAGDQPR
ncbi:MAG: hypothetical protein JO320_18825 [Alphaproteobacteria bacterium]|nr:hypothetical protein [Alphaproteobacteria bacterium]